jgi:hypothetical protein
VLTEPLNFGDGNGGPPLVPAGPLHVQHFHRRIQCERL